MSDPWHGLNGAQKKKMNVIRGEVEDMCDKYGTDKLLAVLLTFKNPYPAREEAERRYKSLYTNLLRGSFECGVTVFERSQKGRPHYHLVAVGRGDDYKTGFDWDTYKRNCELRTLKYQGKLEKALESEYRATTRTYGESANDNLREMWKTYAPKVMKGYGFGMTTIAPVNSAKGTAVYYAKYLGKDGQKDNRDAGHRDYRVWGKRRKIYASHGLMGGNSYKWRMKCQIVAWYMDLPVGHDFSDIAGKRWAFHLQDHIAAVPWQYVKHWLKRPEDLEYPEVQDWSWIREGKAALAAVEQKFISLHDDAKDPEVKKMTSKEFGSLTPRGVSDNKQPFVEFGFAEKLRGEKVDHWSGD